MSRHDYLCFIKRKKTKGINYDSEKWKDQKLELLQNYIVVEEENKNLPPPPRAGIALTIFSQPARDFSF